MGNFWPGLMCALLRMQVSARFLVLERVELDLPTQGNTLSTLKGKFYHFWKFKFRSIAVSMLIVRSYMVPKIIFVFIILFMIN